MKCISFILIVHHFLLTDGTREQKISILFHVLLPPKYLKDILSRHIIPTWLIEESSDLIISLSSIYYHYRTKSECVLSQIQACDTLAILFCGGEYYEKPISKKMKPNKPSPTKNRENNKTSNNENINNIAHQSEESFSNDHRLKYSYSSKYALEHLLSHVREGIYREPYPIEPLFWEGIQKIFDSYSSQSRNTWSILDFSEWADVYMNDSVLDTILHRLFGSGIFLSQRSERKLVADRWLRWEKHYNMKRQQVHKNSFSLGNGVHHEQLFNDLDLMTHEKSHKRNASLDSISKNLPQSRDTKKSLFSKIFNNGNANHEEPTMNGSTHSIDLSGQTTRPKVWGGLGGVDGRGGLGQGVLYLIDKSWWDKWSRYVGWDWTFDEERAGELSSEPYLNPYPEGPASSPPSISNETLVDHSADSPPSGTFGSYYFIHTDLVRNDDFVLVPPGVWDILFLVYGGGPPLPRMVAPQAIPAPFITHESDNNRELEAPENIKKQSSFITSSMDHGVEIEFQASNEDNSTSGVHPIPDNIIIETHPWVVHCLICNPNNPDNGGNVGHMSIRLMCTPKQPLWRLFSEILERLPMHYPHSRDSNGRGRARLWKRIGTKNSSIGTKAASTKNNGSSNVMSKNANKSGSTKTTKTAVRDVSTSTWSLLFGDRYAPFEVISNNKNGPMDSNNYPQQRNLEAAWKEYTNNATVESSGLCFGSFIMFEYAKISENNVFSWPREAAEKEDQELRIAEEEKAFRYLLRGLQDNGKSRDTLPKLKGMIIDAMDSSRRWYEAEIIQYDYTALDDKTTTNEKEENNNDSDEVIETAKRDDREEHEDECKNAIDNTREEIPEQQQIINQQLQSNDTASAEEITRILVRFFNDQNLPDDTVEWIPVISNRLATRGRHTSNGCQNSVKTDATTTSDSSDPNVTGVNPTPTSNVNSSSKPPSDSKNTKAVNSNGNGNSSLNNNANAVAVSGYTKPKMCPYPGYGACGLLNLGNTCYANAALQCVGYMPLLRSYLLSGTYKLDINKENPLGTGGRLLEEFADLLKLIWSAKDSSRAPSKFRQQLAKSNFQFSTSEQQDTQVSFVFSGSPDNCLCNKEVFFLIHNSLTISILLRDIQELLLAMLDSFHEDCNKIRKKPMVPPLDDKWVESTPISRVGREAWWRYLRRNKSVITNIAMGQVLNRVDCPSCSHSSLNFDPFGILSIPFPTINEVVFRCMVLRRGSARNCPDVLDRRNKYSQQQHHHKHGKGTNHPKSPSKFNTSNSSTVVHTPPSDNLVFEEYIISISRLADIGDLKLRLQNLTGIPKSRLKLCTSEDADSNSVSTFINNDNKNSDTRLKIPPQTSIRPLPEKQGPCLQLVNQEQSPAQLQSSPVDSEDKITNIFVFESSLSPRPSLKKIESNSSSSNKNATEGDDAATADTANSDDEKHSSSATIERQRMLKSQIKMYGDSKECVVHDSDPIALSRLMSRKLWPRTSSEFSLGLRVDAIDHRKHWFPGSVVEIMEGSATDNNMQSEEKQESNFTTSNNKAEPVLMVRVHFDNFCSKWDETYTIDDFKLGHVRPLYSHAVPKAPLEFMAYHRFQSQNDLQSSNRYNFFGLPFFLQFHNEWSTARAGAHILAQASRFILRNKNSLPVVTSNGKVEMSQHLNNVDVNVLYHQLADEARLVIAETINVLVESDKRHVLSILTSGNSSTSEEQPRPGSTENSPRSSGRRSVSGATSRSGASTSASLLKKLSVLIPKLPFDVRICDSESPLGSAQNVEITEETAYPFSLVRTIGNFMTARSSIVLQWKPISEVYSNLRSKKRNQRGSFPLANRSDYYPILYTQPTLSIHQRSQAILEGLKRSNSRLSRTSGNNSRRNVANSHIKAASKDAKDMTLNVCLNEFCKDHCAEGWTCPKCGANGEGRQRMTLWNLPDLLTFHVKRFNCSARWREKISIKVNFPLTGLDMKEWCDPQSPVLQGPEDSSIYDLIGVINHLGGMTSGHYVAACKATYCGTEGGEELAYSFSGEGTNGLDEIEKETQVSSGWKLGRNKEKEIASSVQSKVATATAKSIAESHEPLWLQFDDDLVEPIPPSSVVSENAYVLFYRRRRISPSNVAKYNTID